MEAWKDVVGFEGLYKVSESGIVMSLGNGNSTNSETKKQRVIKAKLKTRGYLQVKLSKDSKRAYISVHRIVAKAFIPNEQNKSEVNHIDGNKLNNHVSNLEWNTSSENQKHAFRMGLQKRTVGKESPCAKAIIQLDKEGTIVKEWGGIKECCRETGFNSFGIIKCCKKEKKYRTAYGFKWEYK